MKGRRDQTGNRDTKTASETLNGPACQFWFPSCTVLTKGQVNSVGGFYQPGSCSEGAVISRLTAKELSWEDS